jgi:hypothetical protein
MTTTKQAVRDAKQLFRFCLLDGRVDEDRVRMAVQKVLQVKRRGYLTVLRHFVRLSTNGTPPKSKVPCRCRLTCGPAFKWDWKELMARD